MDTVTQDAGVGGQAAELSLLDLMLSKARELPTEQLDAEYKKGLRLGWRATWFAPTMTVLELVLAERKRTSDVASSEVTR